MVIRDASIDDVNDGLLDLYIEGYRMHYGARKDIFNFKTNDELKEDLIDQLNDNIEKFILIIEENRIRGYASFQYKVRATRSLWIDELIIDKSCRNKGYGKTLLEEIKNRALENDCERVELNCWSFNEDALRFYKKIGYIEQRVILEKYL